MGTKPPRSIHGLEALRLLAKETGSAPGAKN
jgi:hypothetical protein